MKDRIASLFGNAARAALNKENLFLVALFCVSRTVLYVAGLRIGPSNYWESMHTSDPFFLLWDLWQTVLYLHSQPPLFNLLVPTIRIVDFALYDGGSFYILRAIYLFLGLVLHLAIYATLARLGVNRTLGLAATALFMISPASMLFENYVSYTYPVATMLALSALFIHRFLTKETAWAGFLFFSLLACVVLTRAVFHLLWFAVVFAMIAWRYRQKRKTVVVAFLLPFLIAFSWYAKNYYLFDNFGASSWLGYNLARTSVFRLSLEERKSLIEQGHISPATLIDSFTVVEYYPEEVWKKKDTGIVSLDSVYKPAGGGNYNHIGWIAISDEMKKSSLYVIKHYPEIYLDSLKRSILFYFGPSSEWSVTHMNENRAALGSYKKIYYTVILGTVLRDGGTAYIGLMIVFYYAVAIFGGPVLMYRLYRDGRERLPQLLTLAFCWLTIVYATPVCTMFELGENFRFRYMVDPLCLILFVTVVNALFAGRRKLPAPA